MQLNLHHLDCGQSFAHYHTDRSNFQRFFAERLLAEPGLHGSVLDIGCGHGINPCLDRILMPGLVIDGVDPFPVVDPSNHLRNRWTSRLEDLAVPDSSYDLAFSYNVIEHVEDGPSFMRKAIALLKPGGVYWAVAPHGRHPFTLAVRLVQAVGLKRLYRACVNRRSNDYPAWYRLCSVAGLRRALRDCVDEVASVDVFLLHNVQWDVYFPPCLRFVPHLVDRVAILPRSSREFIFACRIIKRRGEG